MGETRYFRLAERSGLAMAVGMVAANGIIGIRSVIDDIITKGNYHYILWIILGVMIWFRISRGTTFYYSRLPVALYTGSAMAMLFVGRVHSGIIKIVIGTVQDPTQLNNLVFIVFMIFTLLYFFYSIKPSPTYSLINKIGLIMVMIALGYSFGSFTLKRAKYISSCWIFFEEALAAWFGG
jgi:hypothetical protein